MIFINQIRQKIGVMYGNPETTTGGLALKFYASVRLEVRRAAAIKDGDTTMGSETKVKVVKNKIAPPFRTAEFELMHDRGIDFEADVMKLAEEDEVVRKSGAFFSYGEHRLGQGKENAKVFLRDNPTVRDAIVQEILAKRRPPMLFPTGEAVIEEPEAGPMPEIVATVAPAKKRGKAE
jgi:recombination protein RecA